MVGHLIKFCSVTFSSVRPVFDLDFNLPCWSHHFQNSIDWSLAVNKPSTNFIQFHFYFSLKGLEYGFGMLFMFVSPCFRKFTGHILEMEPHNRKSYMVFPLTFDFG